MSWVRLDDAFIDNRKFLRAGPLAGYLHIAAIAWANRNLTDGVIPREQPPRLASWHVVNDDLDPDVVGKLGAEEAVRWTCLVDRLVECGLWLERSDGDYEIHDYLDYQKSADQIRGEREKSAQRQERWRRKNTDGHNTGANGGRNDVTHAPRNAVTNKPVTGAPNPNPNPNPEPRTSSPAAVAAEQEDRPEVIQLCSLLADLIVGNDPKAKVAPESRRWRDAMRLLIDVDGREAEEVARIIRWSQSDDFWRSNILSPSKLREKFTQLAGKANQNGSYRPNGPTAQDFLALKGTGP